MHSDNFEMSTRYLISYVFHCSDEIDVVVAFVRQYPEISNVVLTVRFPLGKAIMADIFLEFILLGRMHRQLGLHSDSLHFGPIGNPASTVITMSRSPSIDVAPNPILIRHYNPFVATRRCIIWHAKWMLELLRMSFSRFTCTVGAELVAGGAGRGFGGIAACEDLEEGVEHGEVIDDNSDE